MADRSSPVERRWTLRWWADKAASMYAFCASSLVAYFLGSALVDRLEELRADTVWAISIIAVGLCVAAWRSI